MTQPIDFKTQVDLENFLGYLQQLITDCALFIVDHTNSTIIYEFKSTRLNPSISALSKQQILNNALDTGKFNFKSTNGSTLACLVSCPVAFSTKTTFPTGTPGTNGASPELPLDKSTSPTDISAAALNI